MKQTWTLGEIAERFGMELTGDASATIQGVAPLSRAGAQDISFLARSKHRNKLENCHAGAIIVARADSELVAGARLIADNPLLAFARVAELFVRPPQYTPGIHPTAVVDANSSVSPEACIGPYCSLAADTQVAAGAVLGAGCHVGPGCTIGENCKLLARVTLVQDVHLGARVLIHPGAVIGSDGFGLVWGDDAWAKVPQLGGVIIGDDCEIGANTCIDRGALDDTVLEEDVRVDNMVHIAHNVHVGAHTAMAGCVAIAGSSHIGRYCQIAGGAGIVGHIRIADRVTITARTLVTHSITQSGVWSSGTPLQENHLWRRNAVRMKQLDELARRVTKLEKDTGHD